MERRRGSFASADPDPVVAQDVIDETDKGGSTRGLAGETAMQSDGVCSPSL